MDKRPIGIFDSGLGGLTVVREVQRSMPAEDIIYFGDTARVPYGTKSKETVTRFSKENIEFLLKHDVKLVVVACNTASSLSLSSLVKSYDVPIIGVIKPGVDKALEVSKRAAIGVIGTRATVLSDAYAKFLNAARPALKVVSKACPLFVPLVEEGWLDKEITMNVARDYLDELKNQNVKTLILGCTHYPMLKPVIKKVMGNGVKLVDSACETARVIKETLEEKGLLSDNKKPSSYRYFVTDEPSTFKKVGEMFLGSKIKLIRRV